MKIHKQPEPPDLMRINIKKQNCKTEHIAVEDAEQQTLLDWLKNLIEKQKLSIFATGSITTVEVRESVKGINGKVISFSFKGLEPAEVRDLILKNMPNESNAKIKILMAVLVPGDSTDYSVNNLGCLRYSTNEGKESCCVEPEQMGEYLEKDKHEIIGVTIFNTLKIVIIEKK